MSRRRWAPQWERSHLQSMDFDSLTLDSGEDLAPLTIAYRDLREAQRGAHQRHL